MQRFKGTKGILILVVLVCAIIGYYYYVANREVKSTDEEQSVAITPVQNLILRDLDRYYPPSPKEVVKYFAELTKCFYSETYTDEELEQLAAKLQAICDEELVEKNKDNFLTDLKADVAQFRADKYKITGYYTSNSTDVEEFEEDGYEWARLYCTFYVVQGKKTNVNSEEKILLRKDEEGHWKIYGWDLAD